jgi:hypothetical protein
MAIKSGKKKLKMLQVRVEHLPLKGALLNHLTNQLAFVAIN